MKERRKTQLFQDISNTKCYEGAITENTLLHESFLYTLNRSRD